MVNITFSSITERPEITDLVAGWLWSFWGNSRNYQFYESLVKHCKDDDLPVMYVSFIDDRPAGTVALLRADLFSRQDLTPWLADLYVAPEFRSIGIGSALQDLAIDKARELGYKTLYLYTPLTGYYEKKGWEYTGDEIERDGETVRVYRHRIS